MVLGHVGRRHEHGWHSRELYLRDCAGSGARYHQVGGAVGQVHVGHEGHHLEVLVGDVGRGGVAFVGIQASGLPEYRGTLFEKGFHGLLHGVVDGAGAEAAADYHYKRTVGVEAEAPLGILAAQLERYDVLAHWVAGLHDALGGEEAFHPVVGHADAVGFGGKKFVGHSRIRVLLLDEGGDAAFLSLFQYGPRGVASYAHADVGREVAEHPARLAQRAPELQQHAEIAPDAFAVESGNREPDDVVACGGHALHLHPSLGAYKENLGIGMPALYGVGYRYGRKDMSAGTTAGNQYFHYLADI